jgi:hypothetical protein
MKQLFTLITTATLLIATSTANASIWLASASATPRANLHDLSPVIVTFHAFSDHAFSAEYIEEDFIGTSASAPCTDLKPIMPALNPDLYGNFNDDTLKLTSQQIVAEYGSALTCIKTSFYMGKSHNVYTTGNILLLWDENSSTYTAATPNKVSIDFSKG